MPKNNLKKHLFILAFMLISLGVTSCTQGNPPSVSIDDSPAVTQQKSKSLIKEFPTKTLEADVNYRDGDTWAIYWYVCGSDLESEYGCASIDIAELMEVSLPENVKVIMEAGGSKLWDNGFNPDVLSRCVYDSTGLTMIEELPAASMGDGKTLAEFLTFCNEYYPADHEAVILWDHGGGSVAGIVVDELFDDDSLDMNELYAAFSAAAPPNKEDPAYELIGFDACLMASIDVVATMNGFSRWMVASEESEPGTGWEYESILNALATAGDGFSGKDLGKVICDSFMTANKANAALDESGDAADPAGSDLSTLSVIDMSKADALIDAYTTVGTEALLLVSQGVLSYRDIARAAQKTTNYGPNNRAAGFTNMADLGDFMRKLSGALPQSGNRMLNALDDAVYYMVYGDAEQGSNGISFFYNYDTNDETMRKYSELFGENPYAYLYDYALNNELSDEGLRYLRSQSDLFAAAASVIPEEPARYHAADFEGYRVETIDGHMVMQLDAALMNDMTEVYVSAALSGPTGTYTYLGQCKDLTADWESGVFTENFRGLWAALDGEPVYLGISDESDDYILYDVPLFVNGESQALCVQYTYATKKYEILGAGPGLSESGMSAKQRGSLRIGDEVTILHYAQTNRSMSASDYSLVPVAEITVTKDTCIEEISLDDHFVNLRFGMTDVLNRQAYSMWKVND